MITGILIAVLIAFGVYVYKFPPKSTNTSISSSTTTQHSNAICMDYSNNQISELRVDLIHTMTKKYRNKQLDFINRHVDFEGQNKNDAHSIWFDLVTLKKFIYHIEKTSREVGTGINKNIIDKDLGIRIYYSAYPEKESWKSKFPDLIDFFNDADKQLYEHLHTLVMIPTLNIEGKMVDFNPKDKDTYAHGLYDMPGYVVTPTISTTLKTVAMTGMTENDPDNMTGSQNHGNLIPPADPDPEGF